MRIGLLIYGSLDTVSGGYLYDRMMVDYLRGRGDQVDVISLPWRDYLRHAGDNWSPALYGRLRSGAWDVLLQDELNHPSLFRLNRRLRGAVSFRIVAIVHHLRCCEPRPAWQNHVYRAIELRYLGGVDGFVFNSQTTEAAVGDLVGHEAPRVIAYPGKDHRAAALRPEEILRRAAGPGPLRVLFAGNVIPRKGLHTVLAALATPAVLAPGACRLTVAGSLSVDQAYVREIRRQIDRSHLAADVDLLGAVSDAQLCDLLASHHVLAVPSTYEGYGIVYVEALGSGLPVIASTAGAAHEVFTDGVEGYLVAPGDARAVASRLATLSGDRDRLQAMALAARARYDELPDWRTSAARLREFVARLSGQAGV
jgi:glycosyltransferase involved in cell wall biosynthesis